MGDEPKNLHNGEPKPETIRIRRQYQLLTGRLAGYQFSGRLKAPARGRRSTPDRADRKWTKEVHRHEEDLSSSGPGCHQIWRGARRFDGDQLVCRRE
jgi:hypothetical protein